MFWRLALRRFINFCHAVTVVTAVAVVVLVGVFVVLGSVFVVLVGVFSSGCIVFGTCTWNVFSKNSPAVTQSQKAMRADVALTRTVCSFPRPANLPLGRLFQVFLF